MRAILNSFLLIILTTTLSFGQTSVQNFGTTTGSHASQTGSTIFIPAPTSGTTYARSGIAAASATINLVTATNPLGTTGAYVRAVASTSTSITKISPVVAYTGSTEFYSSFKVLFGDASAGNTATTGIWTFYQGLQGTNYNDNSDVSSANTFIGLRFTFGSSGALTLTYNNAGTYNSTSLTTSAFTQATVYTIEIVGNNKSTGTISYTYGGAAQTVAVQKFDLYINGTQVGNDLSKGGATNNTNIDATSFTGVSSTSNAANLFVDDVVIYNAVPANIGLKTITSTISGNWSAGATWVGGVAPTAADNVVIANGHTVTVDATTTRNSGTTTTVNTGGTLATNVTYTNSGTTTVNGSFQINAGGRATGSNFVYGSAGTLNFNNTTSYGVNNGDVFWPTSSGPFNITILQGGLTLNSGANRTVSGVFQTAAAITLSSATLTINGTAQINANGFFNNAPTYGASSLLKYNTGGTYGRGLEWSATSGVGYPNDVQISNSTILNFPNTGTGAFSTTMALARDITIDASSALYMDYGGGSNKSASLTVGRNISIAGNLSLGDAINGDINIGGNWTHTTGTFSPNTRAVSFNAATGNQTITNAAGETFAFLTINKTTSGDVVLANDITCNNTLTFTKGNIDARTNSKTVFIAATGSVSRTAGFVNGNLQKVAANGANLFEIGTTVYSPATITFTGVSGTVNLNAIATAGNPSGEATPIANSSGINQAARTNHYWTVTKSVTGTFTNYDAKFDFTSTTNTGTISTYVIRKYDAGAWTTTSSTVTGSTVTATGLTSFSDFEVGTPNTLSATAPSSIAKCIGSSHTFTSTITASPTPSIQWRKDGSNISGANSASYTINPVGAGDAGVYDVVITNINGTITPTPGATLTVNTNPTVAVSPTSATICNGGAGVSLTGSGASTYSWSPATGLSATTGATVTANPSTVQTYTVTGTDGNGCTGTAQAVISVNTASTATAGGPNTVCQTASPSAITLSGASVGGGATTGAWSITNVNPANGGLNGTLSSTAQTGSPAGITYTPPANYTGTVTLTLTTDALSSCNAATATRTINISAAPIISASNNGPVCTGGTINLTATSNVTSTYLWSGPSYVNPPITQTVSQDFNSLLSTGSVTWVDNSTIPNWYSQRNGSGTSIIADDGTSNAGALNSYGTTGNSERSLGTIGSGGATAGNFAHGVLIQNTTGASVNSIKVSYTLEQWRNGGNNNGVAQTVTFWYKTSASPITALNPNSNGTWTQVSALSLNSPINTGAAGALDGNIVTNKVSASNVSIGTISLPANNYIMLKWEDPDHTGTDHGLSIDDVSVTLTSTAAVQNPSITNATTANAGVYTLTVTGANTCTAQATTTVVVNTAAAISTQPSNLTVCNNAAASFTVATSGSTPSAYQWQVSSDNGSNWNTATGGVYTNENTATLNISNAEGLSGNQYKVNITGASPCSNAISSTPVTLTVGNTWLGNSTDANLTTNWSCGTPTASMDVTIPAAPTGASMPILSADISVRKLNILGTATVGLNGHTATINGAVSGTGTFTGSATSSLVIGGTAGTINFNNSVAGNNYLKDLTVSGSMTIGANGLNITDGATPGSVTVTGTLNTSDLLTLKSDEFGTARVGQSTGAISGKVTIERFVKGHRAWRFLTAPVQAGTAPSINAAWQEGATTASGTPNPNPGFGTHITGANNTSAGFDQNPSGSYSTKLSTTSNVWDNITNTITDKVTAQDGYMVFVRGSRANVLSSGVNAAVDNTRLRVTGELKQGPQSYPDNFTGISFKVLGNPYASAISMPTTWGGNATTYSVWDPNMTGSNGVGAFITYSWNGALLTWSRSATPISNIQDGVIESGSAFLLQYPAGAATFSLSESNKISGSNMVQNPTSPGEEMRISLNKFNADATVSLQDGMITTYDPAYDNAVNNADAQKANNFAQQISSIRDGIKIAIERRAVIANTDTTYMNMSGMAAGNYQFELQASNLNHPNLLGKLVDNYVGNAAVLDLNGNTVYPFTVDANAGSYAADRFKIVYYSSTPLPVTFTNVTAHQIAPSNAIQVDWKVDNQVNIKEYQVERAADGRNFTAIGRQFATGANGASVNYSLLDGAAVSGDNFYRIKSMGLAGDIRYSMIVKVKIGKSNPMISIYPNPITDRMASVQFTDMPKGNYTLSLVNSIGQIVQTNAITHTGANTAQTLNIDRNIAKGAYQLRIVKPSGEKLVLKLMIVE